MGIKQFIAIVSCLTFTHVAAFGQSGKAATPSCEWYLTTPPSHVREFLEASDYDLSIPHRKLDFPTFKKILGSNFRETDHGNFVTLAGFSYRTARVDRSTYGDASLEGQLIQKSDIDGNPVEMNSFRAIKAGEGDVHSETVDSGVFITGVNVPGVGMTVPAGLLGEAIVSWINKLIQSGQGKGFVALEILHVHPIYELVFKEGPESFVVFPPSEPDVEFARNLSLRQPKVVILFKVLVPNGYEYSVAFLNGKNVTESVLNSPAE